jgi:uncharacterized protein (TIGR01777 family)
LDHDGEPGVNVLVSGSSGLIGSALGERLTAEGHTMVRLVRAPVAAGSATGRVSWNPEAGTIDSPGLERAGPYDAVVHLAGAGIGDARWSPARKQLIVDSRTRSTGLLADSLVAMTVRPPVMISASAVGIYGIRDDEELTEASSTGTDFLAGVCRAWEEAAAPAATGGIRTVLLRSGIVLSRTGGALAKQLPLFRLGLGGRMGSGRQFRSWITLADEINVILHCIEQVDLSGPVNATAPVPATDRELAKALGHALHRPVGLAVPAPALRAVLGKEMAEELVLGGQRVLPAVLRARGFTFAHPELGEAVTSVLARS